MTQRVQSSTPWPAWSAFSQTYVRTTLWQHAAVQLAFCISSRALARSPDFSCSHAPSLREASRNVSHASGLCSGETRVPTPGYLRRLHRRLSPASYSSNHCRGWKKSALHFGRPRRQSAPASPELQEYDHLSSYPLQSPELFQVEKRVSAIRPSILFQRPHSQSFQGINSVAWLEEQSIRQLSQSCELFYSLSDEVSRWYGEPFMCP